MAEQKTATRDGSKSQAIRDYISANPEAKQREILEALTSQGIAVSMGLVSFVKYSKPKAAKRARRSRKAATGSTSGMSAAELVAAKKLVDSIGGVEKTREALELLEKLQ